MAFIFVTIFLDMLALGMIIPVLPSLIEDFLGGNTADAAKIYGVLGSICRSDFTDTMTPIVRLIQQRLEPS